MHLKDLTLQGRNLDELEMRIADSIKRGYKVVRRGCNSDNYNHISKHFAVIRKCDPDEKQN